MKLRSYIPQQSLLKTSIVMPDKQNLINYYWIL